MKDITYLRVSTISAALEAFRRNPGALYMAGGTSVVDLLREGVLVPDVVVDINALPLRDIRTDGDWTRIGAMVSNSDLAWNYSVQSMFPAVSQALLSGGGAQIRNMASVGGNLLQRTRCPYFRELAAACNKRAPGSGCAALTGFNRSHAILGGSDQCIAAHPSDLAVAFAALGARIQTIGPQGERGIPISDFYLEPGNRPDRENVLEPGELILAVELPHSTASSHSLFLKMGDPQGLDFALVSVAVAAEFTGGVLRHVRIALGGVGTIPWRARAAEDRIEGHTPSEGLFAAAAEETLAEAKPRHHNQFKVSLAKRTMISALNRLAKIVTATPPPTLMPAQLQA